MTPKKPSLKRLRSLCAEIHPDDGADPRDWSKDGRPARKVRRKTRQLCGQVAEALAASLAGACNDDVLRDLQVVGVEPAPDASRLLVTVRVDPPSATVGPVQVLEHLDRANGRLRCEVAAAITRKRAPVLAFRVAVGDGT
jgi:ribosome-binding factor A